MVKAERAGMSARFSLLRLQPAPTNPDTTSPPSNKPFHPAPGLAPAAFVAQNVDNSRAHWQVPPSPSLPVDGRRHDHSVLRQGTRDEVRIRQAHRCAKCCNMIPIEEGAFFVILPRAQVVSPKHLFLQSRCLFPCLSLSLFRSRWLGSFALFPKKGRTRVPTRRQLRTTYCSICPAFSTSAAPPCF